MSDDAFEIIPEDLARDDGKPLVDPYLAFEVWLHMMGMHDRFMDPEQNCLEIVDMYGEHVGSN